MRPNTDPNDLSRPKLNQNWFEKISELDQWDEVYQKSNKISENWAEFDKVETKSNKIGTKLGQNSPNWGQGWVGTKWRQMDRVGILGRSKDKVRTVPVYEISSNFG